MKLKKWYYQKEYICCDKYHIHFEACKIIYNPSNDLNTVVYNLIYMKNIIIYYL